MDYKSLLSLAETKVKDSTNDFIVKKRPKDGQTSGPNKAVIEAFKARKEKEELERQREKRREKEKLLSLRAQSSKSWKKAQMMKTRTKDNDFSRIVLTNEQMEEQRRVEEKLKRKGTQDLIQNKKTRNELEDKVIKNGTKNLNNNKLNNNLQNNRFDSKCDKTKDKQNKSNIENHVKPKNTKPALSYDQLLSLATEKAKSEKKSLTEELMTEIEEKKHVRPMTQKEKDRLKEEMYYKQRAHKGIAKLPDPEQIKKMNCEPKKEINSQRKGVVPNSKYNNNKSVPKTPIGSTSQQKDIKTSDKSFKNPDFNNHNNSSNNQIRKPIDRPTNDRQRAPPPPPVRQDSRFAPKSSQSSSSGTNKRDILNKMNSRLNTRDKEYIERRELNASREQQKLPTNNGNRVPNRSIINERARPPSPPPMRRLVPKLPPIGNTYRRGMYEDPSDYVDNDYEEEEEDDDMSDFIDDGPEEKKEEDYSAAIREIFGYDKRKYRNIDDDDDIEEANFAQCMKEDARSARIGLQEDLEEERKEKEELARKALMKKRLKK